MEGLDLLIQLEKKIGNYATQLQVVGDKAAEEVGAEVAKMWRDGAPVGTGPRHASKLGKKQTLKQSIFAYSRSKINDAREKAGLPRIVSVGLGKNYYYSHIGTEFKAHRRKVRGKNYPVKARTHNNQTWVPPISKSVDLAEQLLAQRLEIYSKQVGDALF